MLHACDAVAVADPAEHLILPCTCRPSACGIFLSCLSATYFTVVNFTNHCILA